MYPDRTVIMKRGPKKPDGKVDKAKSRPVHGAVSNGDGTYKSKNGHQNLKPNASKGEAFDGYKPAAGGNEISYFECWEPIS